MKSKYSGNELSSQEEADINSFFWKDKINEAKIARMNLLREKGADLCDFIISICPNSADRSAAIRYLRLAIMQGNSSITNEADK